ncbi:MAG: hypothetical protein ACOVS5_08880 [Oligoflexus sp.]|jgi:hypothetical protein
MQDLVVLDLAEINAVWGGSWGWAEAIDFITGIGESNSIGLDPQETAPSGWITVPISEYPWGPGSPDESGILPGTAVS